MRLIRYNPKNIEEYANKKFITESGSFYSIDEEGKIWGPTSVDGERIELIGTLKEKELFNVEFGTYDGKRDYMLLNSTKIKKGKRLVAILTRDCFERTGKTTLTTSPIIRIQK